MNLIKLSDKREQIDAINDDALQLIESMIPRIKSGEVVAVGISWVDREGAIGGDSSKGDNKISLWASLEHNARAFYNEIINEDE